MPNVNMNFSSRLPVHYCAFVYTDRLISRNIHRIASVVLIIVSNITGAALQVAHDYFHFAKKVHRVIISKLK